MPCSRTHCCWWTRTRQSSPRSPTYFEAALQSERRYDANAITTVAREWRGAQGSGTPPSDLMARVQRQIAAALKA